MLVSLLLAGRAPAADSAPYEQSFDIGPVAVRVDCERTVIGLSETVQIGVTFSAPEHVRIEWPVLSAELDGFQKLGTRQEGPDQIEGLSRPFLVRRWFLRLEPLRLGSFSLNGLTFKYADGSQEWQTGEVKLPTLEIVPGPTSSADPATLRPLPLPPVPKSNSGWAQALRWMGIVLFVGTVTVLLLWRRRSGSESPVQRALEELRQLDGGELADSDAVRDFVGQVSQVVRGYLETAHGLQAPRQSTPEFLSDPHTAQVLRPEQRSALAEFLASADVEKFAAGEPGIEDARRCLRRARAFLAGEHA